MRGNHWITVSNLLSSLEQTCIYDSYLELNVKKEQKKVSYPLTVDKAAKRDKSFTMLVEEIQQQVGGDDCGLFAIAFAVMLCFNEDPCKATYDQNIMRRDLVASFEATDIEKYKTSVATLDNCKQPKVLYEWTCQVHCSCRRPDDGKEMGECIKCKVWFHKECVKTDFTDKWMCRECAYKVRQDAARERISKKHLEASMQDIEMYRNLTLKHPEESKRLQELYNAIAEQYEDFDFLDGESHIGYSSLNDYLEATNDGRGPLMGAANFSKERGYKQHMQFLITIFPLALESDKELLCTVIHEMAHVLVEFTELLSVQAHGKEFDKAARSITRSVKKHWDKLPKPFRNLKIKANYIVRAKCQLSRE